MLDIRCRRKRVRRDSAHHTAVRDIFSLQQKQQAVKVIRRKAASAPCTYSPSNRIRVKYAEKESYRLGAYHFCYRCSVVCVCVCLSVCLLDTIVSPTKAAEPIEMPFGMWTPSTCIRW